MTNVSMRMVFLWAMLGAYGLAAMLGVVSALSFNETSIQLLTTSLVFAGALTIDLMLAILAERGVRSLRWLMFLGICSSVIALVGWLCLIWGHRAMPNSVEELFSRVSGSFTFVALWTLAVGYCFLFKVRQAWFMLITWSLFALSSWFLFLLLAAMIDEEIIEFIAREIFTDDDIFVRILVASIVIFTAGLLALPIIWLINRNLISEGDAVLGHHVEVQIECPRCGASQQLATNYARCSQCRLEIRIKLEEPRCDCGFLLYRFQGSSCPECGRDVPRSKCWAPEST